MHVRVGIRSSIFFYKKVHFCLVIFYICISVFWFVSCPEIYLWKKIYLVNRLEPNCRKSLIPFHAIWGLCWYNFGWPKRENVQQALFRCHWFIWVFLIDTVDESKNITDITSLGKGTFFMSFRLGVFYHRIFFPLTIWCLWQRVVVFVFSASKVFRLSEVFPIGNPCQDFSNRLLVHCIKDC